jgi:hypothetical protein
MGEIANVKAILVGDHFGDREQFLIAVIISENVFITKKERENSERNYEEHRGLFNNPAAKLGLYSTKK